MTRLLILSIRFRLRSSFLSTLSFRFQNGSQNGTNKTNEELIDYIRCMTINKGVPDATYYALSQENINDIVKYMEDPMTASYVFDPKTGGHHERVSSELIYYWMIAFNIPVEFEKWHINRLLMLIKICSKKNSKPSKKDKAAMDRRRAEINQQRLAKMKQRG